MKKATLCSGFFCALCERITSVFAILPGHLLRKINLIAMKTILINVLAIILGIALGGMVNMGLVMLGPDIITPPAGADVTTMEGLKASMHLFQPKHFIMPFLAHALGTLSGAFIAALIARSQKMLFALAIGAFFLIGGISNVILLPSPLWFNLTDLLLAYLPMAYLGGKWGSCASSGFFAGQSTSDQ